MLNIIPLKAIKRFCARQFLVHRSAFLSILTFPRGPKHEGKECRHYQQKEEQWQPHGQGYPPPRTRQHAREFEREQNVERNATNKVELDRAYRFQFCHNMSVVRVQLRF